METPGHISVAINTQWNEGPKERNAISKHDWSKFQEEFDAWIVELGKVG